MNHFKKDLFSRDVYVAMGVTILHEDTVSGRLDGECRVLAINVLCRKCPKAYFYVESSPRTRRKRRG